MLDGSVTPFPERCGHVVETRPCSHHTLPPHSSAPYLLPPPVLGLAPRFTSSFPKYSQLLMARLAVVTPLEVLNSEIFGWVLGVALPVSPCVPPSPARPRCPSPRKPGLILGPVTSSLAGGWSGGNKAGLVPLPHTHPRAQHPRALLPLGFRSCTFQSPSGFSACREQLWFISFGSQAWEALRAGCFHVWVTRESRALAV